MKIQNAPSNKANKPTLMLSSLFWTLVAIFITILGFIAVSYFILAFREYGKFIFPLILTIFLLLSIALLAIAIRQRVEKMIKIFLMLTGASATGIAVGVLLENFLTGTVGEPIFFAIGIIVAPIGLMVGMVGSMVLLFIKRRKIV